MGKIVELNALNLGKMGRVAGFTSSDAELETKLREIGFAEGDEVEVLHRGLFGTPISIRLARTIIALRRREAAAILVEVDE